MRDAQHDTRSDPAAIEHPHRRCRTPGIGKHRHPGIDAERDETVVRQGSCGESLSQVGEKRSTAAGECRRDRRANAVRVYLIKYGTPQPVRLHDAPIKDVRRVGMIHGIGNQLEVREYTIEVQARARSP
jgi:hypothetical protein